MEDAFESVILDNPLPASTGRVCQHPCDNRCRRQTVDEAVNMREVHRFIADSIFVSDRYEAMVQRIAARKLEPTGRKIAIAGAGPTGLTTAFYLAMLGHQVTVFDAKSRGRRHAALRAAGLSSAEIDPAAGDRADRTHGRQVCVRHPDRRRHFPERIQDQFDAAFISIGTWKDSWVYLPGTELKGVHTALNFLESVAKQEQTPPGRKVAIIGGGNAAIDSARTALRMGSEVQILYRRERKDMPAIEEETEAAQQEGAKILFLVRRTASSATRMAT